jgi:hypothetical protein
MIVPIPNNKNMENMKILKNSGTLATQSLNTEELTLGLIITLLYS